MNKKTVFIPKTVLQFEPHDLQAVYYLRMAFITFSFSSGLVQKNQS